MKWIGHENDEPGISHSQNKLKAIQELEEPKNKKTKILLVRFSTYQSTIEIVSTNGFAESTVERNFGTEQRNIPKPLTI